MYRVDFVHKIFGQLFFCLAVQEDAICFLWAVLETQTHPVIKSKSLLVRKEETEEETDPNQLQCVIFLQENEVRTRK